MPKNKHWNPSNQVVQKAYEIASEIDLHLLHSRFYEAQRLCDEEHEVIGNGLGIDKLEELWLKINQARKARFEEIESLILQGDQAEARRLLENSSFSPSILPLSDEEMRLRRLLEKR